MPGLELAGISRKSVPPDARTTPVEAVVDASGDEVHILADRVSTEYAADRYDRGTQNTCRRETVTMVTHEQVIVLDRNRPIVKAVTMRPGEWLAVRSATAALHIPKDVIPGIADLAREQAELFNLGIVSPISRNLSPEQPVVNVTPAALASSRPR
jgi:hypothetical protein